MAKGIGSEMWGRIENPPALKNLSGEKGRLNMGEKFKQIVNEISEKHKLYKIVEDLLDEKKEIANVPDEELEKISDKTGYEVGLIVALFNKIKKEKEEERKKLH